jgi:chromate transporter
VSLAKLGATWARIGAFAYGGGPSMVPLMKTECVAGGYVSDQQFTDALAVGNALPGPIATKLAVYVGWQYAGALGAAVALGALLLPSTVAMLVLYGLLTRYADSPYVKGALLGLRPALVGMLFYTAIELAPTAGRGVERIALGLAAFVALWLEVHPALVVVGAALIGAIWWRP